MFRTLTAVLDESEKIVVGCHPKWLINPKTGKHLELDFLIRRRRVAFEVQGPHHFNDPEQIERDEVKRRLCEENGFKLLRIGILQNNPYDFERCFMIWPKRDTW